MAQYINDPVPKYRPGDLNKTVKDLHSYTAGLSDQLQYLLANLDADNVPELETINKRLTDAEGSVTNLDLTAKGLKLTVQDQENRLTSLTVTVDGIQAGVSDLDGNLSELTQTVGGIGTRVTDAEGNLSALQQTARGLQSQVADAAGNITDLQQTAAGLSAQVSDNADHISSLRLTADGLESTVSDLDGKYSRLQQTVDGFDFTGMVTFDDLDTELEDYARNRDLERGNTVIDGACIQTGEIDVEYVYLHDEMEVYDRSGALGGYIGYCRGYSDDGIGVMHSEDTGQLICTDQGARLNYQEKYLVVTGSNITASEAIDETSDRRAKEDIRYDLEDYEDLFRALRPCTFLYKVRDSGRRHPGFIAQEMEQAVFETGRTGRDFSAYCMDPGRKIPGSEETGAYGIRYTEIVPLNTAMIQKLMRRMDEIEQKIAKMKGGGTDGV